jgi:hypothetical protein
MTGTTGERKEPPPRVAFDRQIRLAFHCVKITSDIKLLGV